MMRGTQPEKSALEGLDRIKRDADAQRTLTSKSLISGMHKSPMRERMEYQNCQFYGATVVSVEGENFWQGAYQQRGAGFLGYWISMEEVLDAWRVYFAPPGGMRFDSRGVPIKNQDFVLHPLCANGDFLVPKKGGIAFLDDGHLILLSKSGLFRGEGGWEIAQEYQAKYREILNENSSLSMRLEQVESELDGAQQTLSESEIQRMAAFDVMKDQQLKYGRTMTAYNRFLVEKDALMAQLDAMHQINSNLKQNLRTTTANLAKQVDDILCLVEGQAIDDSLRAQKSPYPKIMNEKVRQIREKWEQEGIIAPSMDSEKLDQYGKILMSHEEKLRRMEKNMPKGRAPKEGEPEFEPEPEEEPEGEAEHEPEGQSDNRFRRSMKKISRREQPPNEPEQTGESEEKQEGEGTDGQPREI